MILDNQTVRHKNRTVMVRVGKVEPEGRPVRSGQSLCEFQLTGLSEGSIFPILTNDTIIYYQL